MNDNDIASNEVLDALGISQAVRDEILTILGHLPTVDEISTLMAMWHNQGRSQGLLSWLKGQPHAMERHEYLENEMEPQSRDIKEPRVKDCLEIALKICTNNSVPNHETSNDGVLLFRNKGDAIYMVGDVSLFFGNSSYSRQVLHLVDNPLALDDEKEASDYLDIILESLRNNGSIFGHRRIGEGGLFRTMVRCSGNSGIGFDIITCREVRLDAFLFGEQGVRYVVTMDEPREDFFLQKLVEARVNCCFLGRTTKGRVIVDDMDFGPISRYSANRLVIVNR